MAVQGSLLAGVVPNQHDDSRRVVTSLAGRLISCTAGSDTAKLLHAIDATSEPADSSVELSVDFALDETSLTKALEASHFDVAHVRRKQEHAVLLRRGSQHAWISRNPRHAETLLIASPSQARLLVDSKSSRDSTISARPAIASISAWATHHELFPLHASAVSQENDGLILVGEGGRGKTTTALALGLRGWNLIADDRCFVDSKDQMLSVHGFYRTSIVTQDIARKFPDMLGEYIGTTNEGKVATQLPTTMSFARSAKLRGLVLLNRENGAPYRMTRLQPREAFAAWQQTFMLTHPSLSPERSLFSLLTRAYRSVPASRMTLGWDFEMLDDVLRRHLEELKRTPIHEQ